MKRLFMVTARGPVMAETNAEAKELFSSHIDLDALPCDVEIVADEETTQPSHGANHPAVLTFHCLNNAQQILRGEELEAVDYARVGELLGEGTHHAAALYQLFIRTERALEELRVENLRVARCNERIVAMNSDLAERHNTARNTAHKLVEYCGTMPSLALTTAHRLVEILAARPLRLAPKSQEQIA